MENEKQFTREEIELMVADYLSGGKALIKGNLLTEKQRALERNCLAISKQLLAILRANPTIQPGSNNVSAKELEKMINDYESFLRSYNDSGSFSDIENEFAGRLCSRILSISEQLLELRP